MSQSIISPDKIQQIFDRKNEELEREAINEAREIIEEISELQVLINRNTARIEDLRVKLKTLTIEQVEPTKILG